LSILLERKNRQRRQNTSTISEKAQHTETSTKEQAEQLAKSIRDNPAP